MTNARIIAGLLISLAKRIEGFTDAELDSLVLSDRGDPFKARQIRRTKPRTNPEELPLLAEELMKGLALQSSREEAISFLLELAPSKRVLTEAAKIREIHVMKQDTSRAISEKLVENVVGSRLDSARIRGI